MTTTNTDVLTEIIQNNLYFLSTDKILKDTTDIKYLNFDTDLVYERFFADFGPLNLGQIYKYCVKIKDEIEKAPYTRVKVFHYTSNHPHHLINSLLLVMSYEVLMLRKTVQSTFTKFLAAYPSLPSYRDASFSHCQFPLTVFDVVNGMVKSLTTGVFDFSTFKLAEYERYESIKDGDMKWIIPRKILAFSGPTDATRVLMDGSTIWPVSRYAQEFLKLGITNVVRLNDKLYDPTPFISVGMKFHELFFPDGSCPPDRIVKEFLHIIDTSPGGVAVHCKAGLGRTGSLIGCYLINHYGFTAYEAIGWMRLCRPGSVLGAQQSWLLSMELTLKQQVVIPPINLKRSSFDRYINPTKTNIKLSINTYINKINNSPGVVTPSQSLSNRTNSFRFVPGSKSNIPPVKKISIKNRSKSQKELGVNLEENIKSSLILKPIVKPVK